MPFALDVKNQIQNGNIAKVITLLAETHPYFFVRYKNSRIYLQYQLMIEHIKANDLDGALQLSQNFSQFYDEVGVNDPGLYEVMGLLAYENPRQSPLAYLLDNNQRALVADRVNAELLEYFNFTQKQPQLNDVIQQLVVVYRALKIPEK